MRMKVYSPDGSDGLAHEVLASRAKKLVIELGWTFSPPPAPDPFKSKPVPVAAPKKTEEKYVSKKNGSASA